MLKLFIRNVLTTFLRMKEDEMQKKIHLSKFFAWMWHDLSKKYISSKIIEFFPIDLFCLYIACGKFQSWKLFKPKIAKINCLYGNV